jgi:DNA-binding CsgD family transcriptional regulator
VVIFDPTRPELDEKRMAVFASLMQEHPVITYFDKTGDGQALKISDFISTREYHRRAVYQDFYRHIQAEDQMSFAVQIAPGFMIGIAFNRGNRSFTEKDRLRLNLVRPHIIQAYLHLATLSGLSERQEDLHAALHEHGLGVIALNDAGATAHATPGAFECLARYVPVRESATDRLPSRVVEWLRKEDSAEMPLVLSHDTNRLIVRTVFADGRRLLLLSEENSPVSISRLECFQLTPREREVLRWVAEGKSNGEVAVILGLNAGTVKLHVERILEKLGVDNRVMAALLYHGITL